MSIVDAVGRIGSRCGEVAGLYGENLASKKPFSDEAREELAESAAMVSEMYDAVLRFLSDQDAASEQVLDERRRAIIKRQGKARKAHFRRVGSRQCAPENKAVYNQLLLGLERAGNECSNLVEHGAELSMWGDALGADRPGDDEPRRPARRAGRGVRIAGTGACADCARLSVALWKSGRIRKLDFTSIRRRLLTCQSTSKP